MPSYRIQTPAVSLGTFDVLGVDGDQLGFICHTGLAESGGSHKADAIAILDMGPPLHGPNQPNNLHAHAVGCAQLTDDEMQKIRTFVDQHANEHQAMQQLDGLKVLRLAHQMYCIYPHANPFCEDDGRYVRMRFSCAGFVFEAYRFARIRLLEPEALPMIDMAVIKAAYPRHARLMESEKITADSLGLKGEGPWPVLLCGYLLHALGRDAASIRERPYTPAEVDKCFAP
ncbi:MAG TPA: hypothetical protein VLL97_06195 [Acidobacteriota bacterium]|nr:hypothetical protein [Acidobacteriota bacterium]